MRWYEKYGYSDALILSEGRYDAKERHQPLPPLELEEVVHSSWVRVSDRVVRRTLNLNPKGLSFAKAFEEC
jgi:hypothetical protein